jgi:CHASE3 domain sensor protein
MSTKKPTWNELRVALDDAKHAMADARSVLNYETQEHDHNRLSLAIAEAESVLLRCAVSVRSIR